MRYTITSSTLHTPTLYQLDGPDRDFLEMQFRYDRFQRHWSGHSSDRDLSGDLTLWRRGFVAFLILLKSTSYISTLHIGRTYRVHEWITKLQKLRGPQRQENDLTKGKSKSAKDRRAPILQSLLALNFTNHSVPSKINTTDQ